MNELSEEEWRAYVREELRKGDARFDALEERAGKIEAAMTANTLLTQRAVDVSVSTEQKTDEILEKLGGIALAVQHTRATARFVAWFAKWTVIAANRLARWLLPIATLAGILYAWWKGSK